MCILENGSGIPNVYTLPFVAQWLLYVPPADNRDAECFVWGKNLIFKYFPFTYASVYSYPPSPLLALERVNDI
jgi:hypothetical protein